jgi:hypothetical protein
MGPTPDEADHTTIIQKASTTHVIKPKLRSSLKNAMQPQPYQPSPYHPK